MADLVLFGKNVAAQHWRDPERWKEARGYSQSIERLWGPRSVARKIDEGVTIDPDRFKRARPTYDLVSVTPECEVHVRPQSRFARARRDARMEADQSERI